MGATLWIDMTKARTYILEVAYYCLCCEQGLYRLENLIEGE